MWDWLSEALGTLSGAAQEFMGGVERAMEWVGSDSSSSATNAAASAVSEPSSMADAARLGMDKADTGWTAGATGLMASNSDAKEGVWTTAGLKNMLSDLGGWAEKNPKTVVALGSAAAALLKRNESNMTNEILRSHYSSMDATAAGKLALETSAQQNALTSGQNLNVNGLPARRVNGLIQSNVDIPGGYNDRRTRNINYRAPA